MDKDKDERLYGVMPHHISVTHWLFFVGAFVFELGFGARNTGSEKSLMEIKVHIVYMDIIGWCDRKRLGFGR